jgi:uncharacterized protein YjbJ (UPF0337 family)
VANVGTNAEQVKGRVKEAIGSLAGDKELKSEGTADRRASEIKENIDDAKGKVDEVVNKATDKVEEAIDKTKDAVRR